MFTFKDYSEILSKLKELFEFSSFTEFSDKGKVYLRHDIDVFIENSLMLAKVENELNIKSTYMFMTEGEFYNILSRSSEKLITTLKDMGHYVGLHLDMRFVDNSDALQTKDYIMRSFEFFSKYLPLDPVVSFHRPNVKVLKDLELPGIVNVYHRRFFEGIRYFSDSKMRNFVPQLLESLKNDDKTSIQLLIHPLWWDHVEYNILTSVDRYLEMKKQFLRRNFREEMNVFKDLIDSRFFGDMEEIK